MEFACESLIPRRACHGVYLDRIRRYLREVTPVDAESAFERFRGGRVPLGAFHVRGVHHVGIYVGDYEREEDFEAWVESLEASEHVRDLSAGPSYILPRRHGVPGHWISCEIDGRRVELFAARHRGEWGSLPVETRRVRMSHFALAIDHPGHVRPVLDYLAHDPGIEILSFAPEDALGHTYGHLWNAENDRVIELVYDSHA